MSTAGIVRTVLQGAACSMYMYMHNARAERECCEAGPG